MYVVATWTRRRLILFIIVLGWGCCPAYLRLWRWCTAPLGLRWWRGSVKDIPTTATHNNRRRRLCGVSDCGSGRRRWPYVFIFVCIRLVQVLLLPVGYPIIGGGAA